jgi:hypothetical protein
MKQIKVDSCNDCPNVKAYGKYYCGCIEDDTNERKIIEDIYDIPSWCPLDDIEKEGSQC